MENQIAVESLEIERKYEVPVAAELPHGAEFAAIGLDAANPAVYELKAIYFDTPEGDLARLRMALRVRSGGKDAGWHLKKKSDAGNKETLWPASAEMPEAVVALLHDRLGPAAAKIGPIAELQTARTVIRLSDASGREVIELADDRVRALCRTTGVRRAWREWEAELLPDADVELLDQVEPVLFTAGAAPSFSPAKIARAMGRLVGIAEARGAGAEQILALQQLDEADREAARRLES
ncbi:CYTH domain-containing protein [Leucobacter coleopterorum]|uniref:CYTH domain-containing protein n=1 Tax=Leucobacter coleopterorum TaxID=2714933 RepID=A0ABX6JY41_9MICO|nr:CYTH domain-containing protein [Leucobacter coleopterorum]QIM19240.1 CYTH domain-containing protein [Leucobacter coleopterorum]